MTEAATKLTPETFASWWTPIEALAYTARCVGLEGANKALWQLLVSGMIAAIATSSSKTEEGYAPETSTEPRFIPKSQWKDLTESGSDLWAGAYARFWSVGGRNSRPMTRLAFGIKLNPDDVRPDLLPPNPIHEAEVIAVTSPAEPAKVAAPQPPETVQRENKGGRPRKEWWDDFWIEICGRIYEVDLKPKTQAELERTMLSWATNHGHEMSEPTAKIAARKLFKAWKLGG